MKLFCGSIDFGGQCVRDLWQCNCSDLVTDVAVVQANPVASFLMAAMLLETPLSLQKKRSISRTEGSFQAECEFLVKVHRVLNYFTPPS